MFALARNPLGTGARNYLRVAVVEIRGQETVGEVAFDEARRRQFLQQGQGERHSEDTQVLGPFGGQAERVST